MPVHIWLTHLMCCLLPTCLYQCVKLLILKFFVSPLNTKLSSTHRFCWFVSRGFAEESLEPHWLFESSFKDVGVLQTNLFLSKRFYFKAGHLDWHKLLLGSYYLWPIIWFGFYSCQYWNVIMITSTFTMLWKKNKGGKFIFTLVKEKHDKSWPNMTTYAITDKMTFN